MLRRLSKGVASTILLCFRLSEFAAFSSSRHFSQHCFLPCSEYRRHLGVSNSFVCSGRRAFSPRCTRRNAERSLRRALPELSLGYLVPSRFVILTHLVYSLRYRGYELACDFVLFFLSTSRSVTSPYGSFDAGTFYFRSRLPTISARSASASALAVASAICNKRMIGGGSVKIDELKKFEENITKLMESRIYGTVKVHPFFLAEKSFSYVHLD